MATNTNRIILTSLSNEVSPTGFSGPIDSPTIFRKVGDLAHKIAQGAASGKLLLSYNPVAALATVTTTNGNETANDTLTVCGSAITLKSSGATATNQANIAAGTAGTSTSGATPATTAAGAGLSVNINGDGVQTIFPSGASGAAIATSIQTLIRALTPNNALNAVAFSSATCSYSSTYVITSGVKGSNSTVVCGGQGAIALKLGIPNGGTEAAGTATTMNNIATTINLATNTWAGICTAFVCGNILTLTAGLPGTIGNGLALAVSSTGSVMTITHAWGAATAGTEGTAGVFSLGL